jgi:vacuolar iron transporter family protein
MDKRVRRDIERAQANEITEYHIYSQLASLERNKENSRILDDIAKSEVEHYAFFRSITGKDAEPNWCKVSFYVACARLLGLSFTLRLMEQGEVLAQGSYRALAASNPTIATIAQDERSHEISLLALINEEGLAYTGSVVLGLNDALVELTGALAGFTLALQRPRLIAVVGIITGVAAALSMAAAEYLSTKEEGVRNPVKACVYTGIAYSITVALLVAPFLFLHNPMASLGVTVALAVAVIFVFNFYISVAKSLPFGKRFREMAAISLGVAALNYGIGLLLKKYAGV